MEIKTLITFIKSGYSATEIKDMPKSDREIIVELLSNGIEKDKVGEYLEIMREQKNNDPEANNGGDEHENGENGNGKPDYEKMYNDLLKEKQKNNVNENMEDEKNKRDAFKILTDFLEG